jgi:hypothetical protein
MVFFQSQQIMTKIIKIVTIKYYPYIFNCHTIFLQLTK